MTSADKASQAAHILIAEDSGVEAFMLKHVLEALSYQVSIANNGITALELAGKLRPALVISDVNMPGMNGYQLCQRIKVALPGTPVILVTSLSHPDDVLLGLESGADSFIIKPYQKSHLLERVEKALNGSHHGEAQENSPALRVMFRGQSHLIKASREKILDLLLSTYEATVQRNDELHRSREQLRGRTAEALAANRFLDSIIDNIPDLVFIKDAVDLKYVKVNAATEDFMGCPRQLLVGKQDHELFPKEESEGFVSADRETLASNHLVEIPEESVTTHRGIRLLHTKRVAVLNENGEPTHLLGISRDVTDQKELAGRVAFLNVSLQARTEELEAANKSLESFTSAATHDLRSPLSVIGGFAGLLEKKYAHLIDEKGRRYMSVISANVKSMDKLIDDLLAFSRLGLLEVNKAVVDQHQLAEQALVDILQLHPLDQRPVVQLGPLPPVQGDAALLRQVWVNLLSNAVKYSSRAANPVIEVTGRLEGTETIYSVRDNGAGFDMASYDKLFGMFQRLHSDHEFEGTGVGLPIVHRIVTRHGGRIWAEGKVGQGAVFHFALPN